MRTLSRVWIVALLLAVSTGLHAQDAGMVKWKRGTGWGWVWGGADEIGALNEMTDATRSAALKLAKTGRIYDLGAPYDRYSYQWSGHSPTEVMNFRTPAGIKTQKDFSSTTPENGNTSGTAWHTTAIFISDNVGTQIDGLAHVTVGDDNHFYNGFKAAEWNGDFGVRKCDETTIPPIAARGVLVDVATYKGVSALPGKYEITIADLEGALKAEKIDITPGSVVLVRTGTMGAWGEDGRDHKSLDARDSAGVGLSAAKWLVQQKGAMVLGSDTTGFEVYPPTTSGSTDPVHVFLLVEQGVHILEQHNLEALSRDHVYEFAYVMSTEDLRGTMGGTVLRPLALH